MSGVINPTRIVVQSRQLLMIMIPNFVHQPSLHEDLRRTKVLLVMLATVHAHLGLGEHKLKYLLVQHHRGGTEAGILVHHRDASLR